MRTGATNLWCGFGDLRSQTNCCESTFDRVAELLAAKSHQSPRVIHPGCRYDETARPSRRQHQPKTTNNPRTSNLPLDRYYQIRTTTIT